MRAFILTAALLALGAAGCSDDNPAKVAEEAKKAYEGQRWSEAISAYEHLSRLTDGDPAVGYSLALAAYRAGDYPYARDILDQISAKATVGTPTAALCAELRGMVCEAQKDTDQAMTVFRGLVLSDADTSIRVRACSRLAAIYAGQQRTDAALALLLHASNLDPDNATVLFNIGRLCMKDPPALHRAALDAMTKAERLLPDGTPEAKEAANAVSRLTGYLKRTAKTPPAGGDAKSCRNFMAKAETARGKRQWTTAEENAKKAHEADPASFDAALLLARIARQNNHRDTALKAYGDAISLRPDSVDAAYEAAALAYQAKLYTEALGYLRPAVAAVPRKSLQADLMTRILFAQRRNADARIWGEYYLSLITQHSAARDAYRKWVDSLPME